MHRRASEIDDFSTGNVNELRTAFQLTANVLN